jgi:DNA modification methylase
MKHKQLELALTETETETETDKSGPVECLGMTFENDEARRDYFLEKLRDRLKDPEFRKIEGFPIGSDEDILALSDPPYYTACPNPWIGDFIKYYGRPYDPDETYHREPFAADVSEGKNDPIYKLHSYHTKVPYKSIIHFIKHFTNPGDIILDAFCGSGMTTIASLLADRMPISCDISPFCTFLTHNYVFDNTNRELKELDKIIQLIEDKYDKYIHTIDVDGKKHRIQFLVWSDIIICPNCLQEVIFWGNAVNIKNGETYKNFDCPFCKSTINSLSCEKSHEKYYDQRLGLINNRIKRLPVLVNYYDEIKNSHEKPPNEYDIAIIKECEKPIAVEPIAPKEFIIGDMYRAGYHFGMTCMHHFFDPRVLNICEDILYHLKKTYGNYGIFVFTSLLNRLTRMNRFIPSKNGCGIVGPFSGTLYMPPLQVEREPIEYLKEKSKNHIRCSKILGNRNCATTTQSSTTLKQIPDNSIDYIFIDPPFGSNLMYSEINFLYEYWLNVFTNTTHEAIQNNHQKKNIDIYRKLMSEVFSELYRVLKPSRWMTVEFHNSNNSVWQCIQSSLLESGFVVADVRILDKRKITMLQGTHANIAKQDLVISVYKPEYDFEKLFKLEAGTEEGVWSFITSHLKQLPTFVEKDSSAEIISERQNYLLFDRMVAFHVQRGVTVPISAPEFYQGLNQRFPERDGMYFLPEQAAEYDKKRITVKEMIQLQLFVTDEASAIQWLKQQLTQKTQTFQEIHPQFLREIGGWLKHEKSLELSALLEQNFLRYDGKGDVPGQIHSYLSSNFRDMRNLPKDNPELRTKAKDRWYVPDPNKAGDLEKLRERTLLREFQEYKDSKQKRLKVFRLEAIRAGFRKAWQDKDYATIISVACKIPENVLQEDSKLLMWYNHALTRTGGDQ